MRKNICFIKHSTRLALTSAAILMFSAGGASAGTGWCRSANGAHTYPIDYTKTFHGNWQNYSGKVEKRSKHWDLGDEYTAQCDCRGLDLQAPDAPVWYRAEVEGLSPGYNDGVLQYYRLNDYLDVASEVWIGGGLNRLLAVPFENVSNQDSAATCKGYTTEGHYTAGSKGYLSLYIRKPFIGHVVIPKTKIFDLYGSRISGSFGNEPMASVYISGSVTVPRECKVEYLDRTLTVNFGSILSTNFNGKGQEGTPEKRVDVELSCDNITDGVKVQFSFKGAQNKYDPSALATSLGNIGVRVKDADHHTLTPNTGNLPVKFNKFTQKGVATLFLAPINTTDKAPDTGIFNASATLNFEIQ